MARACLLVFAIHWALRGVCGEAGFRCKVEEAASTGCHEFLVADFTANFAHGCHPFFRTDCRYLNRGAVLNCQTWHCKFLSTVDPLGPLDILDVGSIPVSKIRSKVVYRKRTKNRTALAGASAPSAVSTPTSVTASTPATTTTDTTTASSTSPSTTTVSTRSSSAATVRERSRADSTQDRERERVQTQKDGKKKKRLQNWVERERRRPQYRAAQTHYREERGKEALRAFRHRNNLSEASNDNSTDPSLRTFSRSLLPSTSASLPPSPPPSIAARSGSGTTKEATTLPPLPPENKVLTSTPAALTSTAAPEDEAELHPLVAAVAANYSSSTSPLQQPPVTHRCTTKWGGSYTCTVRVKSSAQCMQAEGDGSCSFPCALETCEITVGMNPECRVATCEMPDVLPPAKVMWSGLYLSLAWTLLTFSYGMKVAARAVICRPRRQNRHGGRQQLSQDEEEEERQQQEFQRQRLQQPQASSPQPPSQSSRCWNAFCLACVKVFSRRGGRGGSGLGSQNDLLNNAEWGHGHAHGNPTVSTPSPRAGTGTGGGSLPPIVRIGEDGANAAAGSAAGAAAAAGAGGAAATRVVIHPLPLSSGSTPPPFPAGQEKEEEEEK